MKFFSLDLVKIETHQQKKTLLFVFGALFLSIWLTLISYPGVLYSDSYERWRISKEILTSLHNKSFGTLESWLSVTPQFFMALLYQFTYNVASFTIVQSFLFFFTSFLIIDKYLGAYKIFCTFLFILCPIFYGFSVYHEMAVGCVIGINLFILLIYNEKINKKLNDSSVIYKILFLLILSFSFYIIFGFRQNAFTIIPVIVFIFIRIYKKIKNRALLFLNIGALIISIMGISQLPGILGFKTIYDSSSAGFVWEMLSTIQKMPSDKQQEYKEYLDYLGEKGDTERALQVNDGDSVNKWLWSIFKTGVIGSKENSARIKRDYFSLLKNEPKYFISNKVNFIAKSMGVGYTLSDREFYYNSSEQMKNYGMVDNPLRKTFIESYNLTHRTLTVFRKPYLIFLITLFMLILSLKLWDKQVWMQMVELFLIALFYYGAFLVNNQSFEFRYFFPAFYYLIIILIACAGIIVRNIVNRIRRNALLDG